MPEGILCLNLARKPKLLLKPLNLGKSIYLCLLPLFKVHSGVLRRRQWLEMEPLARGRISLTSLVHVPILEEIPLSRWKQEISSTLLKILGVDVLLALDILAMS